MTKGFSSVIIFLTISFFIIVVVVTQTNSLFINKNYESKEVVVPSPSPTPPALPYTKPTLSDQESYRIILIGDSMTESLGLNANPLRLALQEYYPEKEFVTYNYSIPSSNILSVEERLTIGAIYLGQSMPPILNQGFDILIFESFAYNPLSEFSIEEGLQKQDEVFETVLTTLIDDRPESVVMMMDMIAPDRQTFARASRDLSQVVRDQWIDERFAYMQNAKEFAEENNIPFIDIYENSIDAEGDGTERYISSDTIHPSKAGGEFIARTIAEYIFDNNIIPQSD